MKEISIYNENGIHQLAQELRKSAGEGHVYMCIGTEKVFSDSLGPRVGQILNERMTKPLFVYGMDSRNITAENLMYCHDFIKQLHPDSKIVVVDAAVGDKEQIGQVQISSGGIVPGAATNKNLPVIGDVSVVGIVAEKGMGDFYTTNSEKEKLVNRIAQFISQSILRANG